MTAKKKVAEIDGAKILAELQRLTERVSIAEDENSRLRTALEDAKKTGSFTDEFGQKVNCLDQSMENVNAGMHDRPGTITETLDIMEKQAKIRREKFDRERTRKILMGEEVEDLSHFICERCGRSEARWNDNPDLFDAHVEAHITGKSRAYRTKRVRPVDQEDDEATERALLARLSEKYGVEVAAS